MSKKSFIDSIKVASPCSESWDEMTGTDRIRFCSHCSKDVNDLSAITRKEAMRVVRASGGNICVRYVEHPVTRRAVFGDQLFQITRRAPAVAAGVMTASMALATQAYGQQQAGTPSTPVVVTTSPTPIPVNIDPITVTPTIEPMPVIDVPQQTVTVTSGMVMSLPAMRRTTPIGLALDSEELEKVRDLIARGENVNAREADRSTPLFAAVESGDIAVVRLLLDFGAKVNVRNKARQTPLMQIDGDATEELIELLSSKGAKLNLIDEDGDTALMIAAEHSSPDVIRALISAGADVNVANKQGETALMKAADRGDIESVRALLLAGAKVNARDAAGENAWDHASDEDVEQMLVSFGAEYNTEPIDISPEN